MCGEGGNNHLINLHIYTLTVHFGTVLTLENVLKNSSNKRGKKAKYK